MKELVIVMKKDQTAKTKIAKKVVMEVNKEEMDNKKEEIAHPKLILNLVPKAGMLHKHQVTVKQELALPNLPRQIAKVQ